MPSWGTSTAHEDDDLQVEEGDQRIDDGTDDAAKWETPAQAREAERGRDSDVRANGRE